MLHAYDLEVHCLIYPHPNGQLWVAQGIEWHGGSVGDTPEQAGQNLAEVIRRWANGVEMPAAPGCAAVELRSAPEHQMDDWRRTRAQQPDRAGLCRVRGATIQS